MPKKLLTQIKEFFFGRPLTKHGILLERLKACRAGSGCKPFDVENFWTGIEDLKGLVCLECGAYLDQETQKCKRCDNA